MNLHKKTKNDCKLEDPFQKNGQFAIADTRIKRPHITRSTCTINTNLRCGKVIRSIPNKSVNKTPDLKKRQKK